jgi:phenylacetate-CoA ligase
MNTPRVGSYSADEILEMIRTKKSAFWSRVREERPLELFHEVATRVPAYKDFLKKNRIDPAKIKTFQDFQSVPPVNKKNYLREYPLEKLCWDGSLKKPLVFTATSGSTGEPFYFPRGEKLDWQYSVLIEMFLQNSTFGINQPTLVIVGFGMGAWIGGLITYKAFEIAAQRGNYPVSIITPGINKPEIFRALKKLSPQYKQTILVGYPPFIKDVVDEASGEGVNLKKLNIRVLCAAEMFNEKFRDYVAKNAGIKDVHFNTLNIYGTADIGAMAWETPLSILVRRYAMKNAKLFGQLFGEINKTPTLAQYNPFFITFESVNSDVLLTGDNAVPLIRYAVGDTGGVLTANDVFKNILIKEEKAINYLPFVYVYERSDFSTKLYGAIIYPEPVREALQDSKITKFLTGKFAMLTKTDESHNEYLEINVELKPRNKGSKELRDSLASIIIRNLIAKNAEYRNNYHSIPQRVTPRIIFWPYGDQNYFKVGIKQKWVATQPKLT